MESGAISDGQITASSQHDDSHAPFHGRLRSGRHWAAATKDLNQWFQVDLISQYTKITRVATQGINENIEWVTGYRLRYRNDGASFQYYTEQGQNTDKVSIL